MNLNLDISRRMSESFPLFHSLISPFDSLDLSFTLFERIYSFLSSFAAGKSPL